MVDDNLGDQAVKNADHKAKNDEKVFGPAKS
jgi:hypothetical protein